MTSIRPLGDKIVAEKPVVKTQTASGLYLPDTAKERSTSAQVIAVGPDVKAIKKGDQIIYKEYSTSEIKLNEQEFLIIKEEDVLGVVEGAK